MRDTLHFRPASEADLDRLVEVHFRAFPDPRGEVERRRNFRDNPFGPLSKLVVAEASGTLVAHAFLFDFVLGCRGVPLPVSGVASVGVAPEARGKGVGTALLEHLHRVARERGHVASLLFPFREGYYARLGYGKTSPTLCIEAAPNAFRAIRGGARVRSANGSDQGRVAAFHAGHVRRGLGRLERNEATWAKRWADHRRYFVVAEREGELVGYASLGFEQDESHSKVTLVVHELLALDSDAERSLVETLGAQRDHVHDVYFEVPYGSHWPQTLGDIDAHRHGSERREHTIGCMSAGPMVRALDIEAILRTRPLASQGSLSLYVSEEDATYTFIHETGSRSVARVTGPLPDALHTSLSGVSSLLLGGISVSALSAAGLCRAPSAVIAEASALLGQDVFFGCDAF